MSFRIENKYKIHLQKLTSFYDYLKDKNIKLLFEKREILSTYFDNVNLTSYNESIEGTTPRKKIRIRTYPNKNDKNYFFEVKINSPEGKFKFSKNLTNHEFFQKGYYDFEYGQCYPIVSVKYDREYFIMKDLRITVDKDISYSFYGKPFFSTLNNQIIVEVKTNNLLLDEKIENLFPFEKTRFSKYCNCIEELYS